MNNLVTYAKQDILLTLNNIKGFDIMFSYEANCEIIVLNRFTLKYFDCKVTCSMLCVYDSIHVNNIDLFANIEVYTQFAN